MFDKTIDKRFPPLNIGTVLHTMFIGTDFKYFFVSGFSSPFEKAPAPRDITK